jgi:hypothetical protein
MKADPDEIFWARYPAHMYRVIWGRKNGCFTASWIDTSLEPEFRLRLKDEVRELSRKLCPGAKKWNG